MLRGRLQMVTEPQDLQVGTALPWQELSLKHGSALVVANQMFWVRVLLKGK